MVLVHLIHLHYLVVGATASEGAETVVAGDADYMDTGTVREHVSERAMSCGVVFSALERVEVPEVQSMAYGSLKG